MRIESPTLNSSPVVDGVSSRANGSVVSGADGFGGVTGAVPVGPPLMPLPKRGPAGGLSQDITMRTPTAATANRTRGKRIVLQLLRITPRLHRQITFIDDVRRDENQQIPLRLAPVGDAEEASDQRKVDEQRDTGFCDTDAGLRQPA